MFGIFKRKKPEEEQQSAGNNIEEENNDLEIRLEALECVFGPTDENHLHGVIPFFLGQEMGGTADVVTFSNHNTYGKLYVTTELVGLEDQKPNSHGTYELAVCQKEPDTWALDIMLHLTHYTLETPLDHGETMDIGPVVPEGSNIVAFLFKRIAELEAFSQKGNVICCIGITQEELDYKLKNSGKKLLEKLPAEYIATETVRDSFV